MRIRNHELRMTNNKGFRIKKLEIITQKPEVFR